MALAAVSTAAWGASTAVHAQLFDARALGMGGVAVSGGGQGIAQVNPAYRAVPREGRDQAGVQPLPLGLLQTAFGYPGLDPSHAAFNLVGVVDYALNIPTALELLGPDRPSETIDSSVERDPLVVDLRAARDALPDAGFHIGALQRARDLGLTLDLGRSRGVLHLSAVQPFAHNELDFTMDEALQQVLDGSRPIDAGRVYRAHAAAVVQGGFSSGATYARELPLPRAGAIHVPPGTDWMQAWWEADWRRPRMWVGGAYRRTFGLGLAHLDGNAQLTGVSTGPANAASLGVDYEALYTTASPDGPFDLASGQAVDAGVVVRWRNLELGAGVADLFADLTWDGAHRNRFTFDEQRGRVVRELLDDDLRVVEDVPTRWLVNGAWSAPQWVVATDVGRSPGGTSAHLGGEWWRTPQVALRAGVELDQRDLLQGGVGVGLRGLRGSRWGLDVGLRSHSRTLNGVRGVAAALALVLE